MKAHGGRERAGLRLRRRQGSCALSFWSGRRPSARWAEARVPQNWLRGEPAGEELPEAQGGPGSRGAAETPLPPGQAPGLS